MENFIFCAVPVHFRKLCCIKKKKKLFSVCDAPKGFMKAYGL